MPHIIRKLQPQDHAAWKRLFAAYVAFYRAEVSDEVIELTWQRTIGPAPSFIGLAAVDGDGALAGFAMALLHRSTWSPTWYCYLEDLFVDPAVRSQGIGRALIQAVYREADAAGATRTYWVTETENDPARRLYDDVATLAPFVQYRRA
ncbi:MAG: GNAT family N-acetyltransferase [Hyphomicrobiaceae bacterium]